MSLYTIELVIIEFYTTLCNLRDDIILSSNLFSCFFIKGILNVSVANTSVERYSRLYINLFIIIIYSMD
jgi:hypothetical protein